MKHKDMNYEQRKILERSLHESRIEVIAILSIEPFIKLSDGTVIYIDEVNLK